MHRNAPEGSSGRSEARSRPVAPSDAEVGLERFDRYVRRLADADGPGAAYPGLPSRAWHNPDEFPLVGYLESNFPAIRNEISQLEAVRFHRESERIARSGDWDVAFLYERGRRHEEVCAACPVAAAGIERFAAIRTPVGLIYVSRMRASTHIEAHRGPTNVRLRCHLAITVPAGDCALKVDGETRQLAGGQVPGLRRLPPPRGLELHRGGSDRAGRRPVAFRPHRRRGDAAGGVGQLHLPASPQAQPLLVGKCLSGGPLEVAPVAAAPATAVAAVAPASVSAVSVSAVSVTEQIADRPGAEAEPGAERGAHQQGR